MYAILIFLTAVQPFYFLSIDSWLSNYDWSVALPFKRELKLTYPLMNGKDVTILQNLLRRHEGINVKATSYYDKQTSTAVKQFQKDIALKTTGILNVETGEKVIELLMSDDYKDDGTIPKWAKYKLYVPVHQDRTKETTAVLYGSNGDVLHSFPVRARGGTGDHGTHLNQLTTNGDTPTGLGYLDLNSPEPVSYVKQYGPYPVLRVTKGIKGNMAIGRDGFIGIDGPDTFLSNYRFGILLHTGIWDNWKEGVPMPDSLGCMKTYPRDMKLIVDVLVNITGTTINKNLFGKLPYPYKPQGIISVEQID